MSLPRRHHFIPQFILRGFCSRRNGDEVLVWMFRHGVDPKEVNTKNLGQERDFHGNPATSNLEFLMQEHEDRFAPLVAGLRDREPRDSEIVLLREYVVHLMVRTKHVRTGIRLAGDLFFEKAQDAVPRMNRRAMKHQVQKAARKQLRESGLINLIKQLPRSQQKLFRHKWSEMIRNVDIRPTLAEAFRQFRELADLGDITANAHIKTMTSDAVPQTRVESISHLTWQLIRAPRGTFILGDIVVFGKFRGADDLRSVLSAGSPIELVMTPLSDKVCLVGRSSPEVALPSIDEINLAAAELSRDFFVAAQATEQEYRYHEKLGTRAEIAMANEILEAVRDIV